MQEEEDGKQDIQKRRKRESRTEKEGRGKAEQKKKEEGKQNRKRGKLKRAKLLSLSPSCRGRGELFVLLYSLAISAHQETNKLSQSRAWQRCHLTVFASCSCN